uniref:hypothetical protein n=1 Tax=Prevotella sp. TaxID=59823 RepID=UPI0040279D60
VAVTVQSRCRYGVIALPLQCNRIAVSLKSRCDCTVTAMIFSQNPVCGVEEGHLRAVFPL